jgi:hypothetical protein
MADRALYATIRGIAFLCNLERVELDNGAKTAYGSLTTRGGLPPGCPTCRGSTQLINQVERSWRHLGTRRHAKRRRTEQVPTMMKTIVILAAHL